jgi:hypothetical protein
MQGLHDPHARSAGPIEPAGRRRFESDFLIAELDRLQTRIDENFHFGGDGGCQPKIVGGRHAVDDKAHLVSTGHAEAAAEDETLRTAAGANTLENFKHVFDRMVEGLFIDRLDGNEEIVDRIMNDPAFRNLASDQLMREVYERLRRPAGE